MSLARKAAAGSGRALLLAAALLVGCAPGPGAGPPRPEVRGPKLPELPTPSGAALPERVLLISIHGLVPAHYLPGSPAMPTLAALGEAGVAAEAVHPVFPPTVYPTHTSLVSGRPPAEHGIPADQRIGRRGVRSEPYAHASLVRGRTLWQAVSEGGRPVAALDWPATSGAALAALLPEASAARGGDTWIARLADAATPWVLELAREAGAGDPAALPPGPEHDGVLVRAACRLLASPAPPALLLLRLSQTEPVLARFGPTSSQARAAFARADAALGELIRCLEGAGRLSGTALVVAGDHGLLPVHTAVRPNAFLAEAGLIATGPRRRATAWRALARSNGGSAFVYARDEEAAVAARRALEEAARETRAFSILSAEQMLALGADPEAWFGLRAARGFVFEDGLALPPLAASARRGAGGYLPGEPAMTTGFVGFGPGFRRGVRVPELEQTDVAPTVARLLGVSLGRTEGRVLVGLLNPAGARGAMREEGRRGP